MLSIIVTWYVCVCACACACVCVCWSGVLCSAGAVLGQPEEPRGPSHGRPAPALGGQWLT